MEVHSNVYAQYCGYNTKMGGYTHCRYTGVICSTADMPELGVIGQCGLKKRIKKKRC